MVRSKEGKQLELLRTLSNDFPEITLDKNDIDSINRRRMVDILIANKDIDVILNTLEQLGLDKGVLGKDILAKIHMVSNDVLYSIKGLYFRTHSKVRPEVFLATFASLLVDNVGIAEMSSVMRRTLETEVANAERVAARAAEKENERNKQMNNQEQLQEQPTVVIDLNNLNNPIRIKDVNEVADRRIEEFREEHNASDELKENVEETLNEFKDSLSDLKEETINKTQEAFNKLKEAREKKEEKKKQEETSSVWLKLAVGATVGTVIGIGIWAYKKYFEE